jgi:3-hydroxyisobutyrate dehydrogenase-like beta-hydroxyacid dehydrogenase
LTFKRPKLEAREWSPEFPLRLALKDIRLALACAREAGLELAQANTCEQLYSKAFDRSLGDLDISAIHEVVSGL